MKALAFALVLALSLPARALDCSQQPDPVAGQPISDDQLKCLQVAIVTLRYTAEESRIEAVRQAQLAAACEATATIACPRPEVPIVPFLAGTATGVVLAVVAAALIFAATR